MREFSKDLKSTVLFPNSDKKRCKTVNNKRKCSESIKASEEVSIGKYKYFTDCLLGEGFSSKVYKGTQVDKPQKRYAIKVIQLQKFEGDTLKMLQEQINIHLKLKHQNVVECFDAIKQKQTYYLILQFCPHGSLEDFIQRKKKVGLNDACEIMDQISCGYKYLLTNNIVHRDIKPANILKVDNTWKIADFGFAVRKCMTFTSPLNVGTPLYMPIEALVRNQYSFKSDIFALGVTFYQMLHGQTPWPCRTEEELIQKLRTEPLFISNYINNEEIKKFLHKACTINHKDRMSHQEFLQIQFGNFLSNHKNAFKQKIVFRAISPRKNTLQQTDRSLNILEANKSPKKDTIRESHITEGDILAEVTICKHIYSMISNIESFLLDQSTKQFFWMTLFKFLVRFVRETEKKSETIKSTCDKNVYNQIKELALRYEKQYLDYLKHLEVKIIREVNNKFSELCNKNPFGKSFYQRVQAYLLSIMKEIDTQLMEILKNKQKPQVYKDKIEAFRALKKLYEYCYENSLSENSGCRKTLQVCANFKAIVRNNQSDYYHLRKVLVSA